MQGNAHVFIFLHSQNFCNFAWNNVLPRNMKRIIGLLFLSVLLTAVVPSGCTAFAAAPQDEGITVVSESTDEEGEKGDSAIAQSTKGIQEEDNVDATFTKTFLKSFLRDTPLSVKLMLLFPLLILLIPILLVVLVVVLIVRSARGNSQKRQTTKSAETQPTDEGERLEKRQTYFVRKLALGIGFAAMGYILNSKTLIAVALLLLCIAAGDGFLLLYHNKKNRNTLQ